MRKRLLSASITPPVLWLLVSASGCGQPGPPFSPQKALTTFRLPEGFRIELVAAEPEVADPVALAFDERGRLYVAEMADYPVKETADSRVRLLEDRDGDGYFEHSALFAENLRFVSSVMPWKEGVLVAHIGEILFLQDTDGDDKADVRRPVITGFPSNYPQRVVNSLQYGLDNWIYAAYPPYRSLTRYPSLSGVPTGGLRFPEHDNALFEDVQGMDIRFRPDQALLEPIAGSTQYGTSFDSWGNRFVTWNNVPIRHVVIQNRYLSRNPYLAVASSMHESSERAGKIYPRTVNPLYAHFSEIGRTTSACGISIYTGGRFPAEYDGNSYVCEPAHGVVHRDILKPMGATFLAKRAEEQDEFLTSTDSWFRPVFSTVGPDGGLYIADMYRKIIEHPEFLSEDLLIDSELYAGADRGRIYRIVHDSARRAPEPALDTLSAVDLVRQLASPNRWRRINAQRILVSRQERPVLPALEQMAQQERSAVGRLHALWTLEGLKGLSTELILQALQDENPGVRENAIRLAEERLTDANLKTKLLTMVDDPEARVQFQLACTLGMLPPGESFDGLQRIAFRHIDDRWFQIAVLSGASDTALSWLEAAIKRVPSLNKRTEPRAMFFTRIASIIGARRRDREIAGVLSRIGGNSSDSEARWRQKAVMDGLAQGLDQGQARTTRLPASERLLLTFLESPDPGLRESALRALGTFEVESSPPLRKLVKQAARVARDPTASEQARVEAVAIVALDDGAALRLLEELIKPTQPEAVQIASVRALAELESGSLAEMLLDHWRSYTAQVREAVLSALLRNRRGVESLLDAVEAEVVQPWSISGSPRRRLLQYSSRALRERAIRLLEAEGDEARKQVVERYRPALNRSGDRQNGKEIFKRACSECHRLDSLGFELGPDLHSVADRTKERLLTDILMPSQSIETGYEEYLVKLADGRLISGVISAETATSLTVRRPKGEQDTILRHNIAELRSLNLSPMPDDFENQLSVEEMADLLEYLKSLN